MREKKMGKMGKMKSRMIVCSSAAALLLALSCAGAPKQKTEVLDDKGAAFNMPAPAWVSAYVSDGNHAVEQLEQYKNEHCFVVEFNDKSRDFAVNWVNNASGPAQVAAMISQTVLTDAKNRSKGARGEDVSAQLDSAAHSMSEASYTGLRKMGDWWQIVRNRATKLEEARAFALYTVDKKNLDNQVAGNLQQVIDNNKALSEAARGIYTDLIKDIRAKGFNNR